MTIFDTVIWRAFLAILGAILLVGVYVSVQELSIYFGRNPSIAEADAWAYFYRICEYERLDPSEFVGPTRLNVEQDEKNAQYTFLWTKSQDETIWMAVSYLPYELNYSISAALTERKLSACIARANDRNVREGNRQSFINNCLALNHQPNAMGDKKLGACIVRANDQSLKGEDRQYFIDGCLGLNNQP